jgi:hypothetical protein
LKRYNDNNDRKITKIFKRALFTFSGRISGRREAPDVASIAEGIAGSPLAEAIDATDGCLAGGRKLTEKVNKAFKRTALLPQPLPDQTIHHYFAIFSTLAFSDESSPVNRQIGQIL